MRKTRRIAAAIALAAALTVGSPASASTPGDDRDFRDLKSMIKHVIGRIVTVLEDIRSGIPP
jgi:hypothetical protein